MKTKHLIFSSILLLIVSCKENVKTYNDKSKPLNERILTFSQNYVNNNLKSFNNRSMSVKTSDIFRECDSGKYYVFSYDTWSTGSFEYIFTGEVIINYDSQTKEISLSRDNIIEDMSKSVYYFLSEVCKNDKIQFIGKY